MMGVVYLWPYYPVVPAFVGTTSNSFRYDRSWGFRWMELFLSYLFMHLSSLLMGMLLKNIYVYQQSDINRVISIEWYQHCAINRVTQKRTEQNRTEQVLRLQVDGPGNMVWVVFVIFFALSTHCKYDFIHLTYPQLMSTWILRICHIALTAVLSKIEHRLLYPSFWQPWHSWYQS